MRSIIPVLLTVVCHTQPRGSRLNMTKSSKDLCRFWGCARARTEGSWSTSEDRRWYGRGTAMRTTV